VIEKIVGIFIPPACREEVLGDMRERATLMDGGTQLFLYDALRTVPLVIASRIRRTTDSVVLFMEAFCCYVSFLAPAWALDRPMIYQQGGLLRLAIPCAIALAILVLADAYANPRKKSWLRPFLSVTMAFVGVFLVHLFHPLLEQKMLAIGSAFSIMLLLMVRMLFPPLADRPQQAQGPAFWQKQEIVAAGVLKATVAVAGLLFLASSVPERLRPPVLGVAIIGGAIYAIIRII
jgi:hypothetical protein